MDCHDTAGASSHIGFSSYSWCFYQISIAQDLADASSRHIDWYDSAGAASVHRLSKILQLHLAYSVDTIWGLHGYFRAMPKVA